MVHRRLRGPCRCGRLTSNVSRRNMETELPSVLLASAAIARLDECAVAEYNARAKPIHFLHTELGPSSYEGDIDRARVILLLSNPGFDAGSTIEDHRYYVSDWPLSGLHADAPAGLRAWWSARLRLLIEEFGAHVVSKTIACIQLTPWASEKFDESLRLPSRELHLRAAGACAQRGAVMLIMRSERYWLESDKLQISSRRFRVNAPRTSYVSPGNLPAEAWQAVRSAFVAG